MKRIWLPIGLMMVMPCVASAEISSDDGGRAAVAKASALLKAGKAAEAMVPLDEAIQYYERANSNETRQIYCGMSGTETLLYMGMASAAKRSAEALGPEWCEALFLKGYALIDRGNVSSGIAVLERALAMAPQHAHYLNELAYAYQEQKDWSKSLDAYQRAEGGADLADKADIMTEKARALRGQGFVYVEVGRLDDAEKAYRRALKLDPHDERAKGELDYIRDQKNKRN